MFTAVKTTTLYSPNSVYAKGELPERFDKAARASNPAKGLVHYKGRLHKARQRGKARKIAKFERKVQKYNALGDLREPYDAAGKEEADDLAAPGMMLGAFLSGPW